jgi:hypothetical protein
MSDDLVPISDEQAKLGQEALKTLRGIGAFLAKAFGSTPEDLVGYLGGDWVRLRRAENIARMLHRAKTRLEEEGIIEPKPASLSVALPILRGAADEDREELVDLWARLLANAMDPKLNSVRLRFIEAVKEMDPMDTKILEEMYKMPAAGQAENDLASRLRVSRDEVDVSIQNLRRLGCIMNPPSPVSLSAFGRELMRACYT